MNTHTTLDSPIGELTLVNADGVLSGLYMAEHQRRPDAATFGPATAVGFEQVSAELVEYFAGRRTEFTVRTAPVGTVFQQRVWALLRQIPSGQTRTYGQLAGELDESGGWNIARAVGSANARNPISIIVPCHRVVGANGALTGYAGGLERKKFLLALENPALVATGTLF